MPPKKRLAKELPTESPSQTVGDQDLTTHIPQTNHPHTSTESHAVVADARRPEGPAGQPPTQAEVFATNSATPYLPPSSSQQQHHHNQDPHWEAEAQQDQPQDFEDEIEVIIEDELVHLRVGAQGHVESSHEESSNYAAAADWARESNASWATAGHWSSSSARARALNIRAFTLATPVVAGPITATAAAPITFGGRYHWQQMPVDWQFTAGTMAAPIQSSTSTKIYGKSDPRKFLMCNEAAIALSGRDDTTLTKSFIISLESAVANWYARLQPRSITSWGQLKEKFLVKFQGFQTELSIEEDFLSCQQYEREILLDFFREFLHLKAQAPEVSDEQVIMQAIKALCTDQLHSYLVRECNTHFLQE
jgi:hypothetical protein